MFAMVNKHAGTYRNLCVQNKEKSISLKTMEDGQVLLYSVSLRSIAAMVFNQALLINLFTIKQSSDLGILFLRFYVD